MKWKKYSDIRIEMRILLIAMIAEIILLAGAEICSETDDGGQLLVVPKVGSAVIVGSLSGDLAELAVLAIDKAESITLTATTVTLNGGKLGGLVKVAELTQKLNELVQAFNGHTHTGTHGPTSPPVSQAKAFSKDDYEDTTVKH